MRNSLYLGVRKVGTSVELALHTSTIQIKLRQFVEIFVGLIQYIFNWSQRYTHYHLQLRFGPTSLPYSSAPGTPCFCAGAAHIHRKSSCVKQKLCRVRT